MTSTALGGTPVSLVGDLPSPGAPAPAYSLTGTDLGEVVRADGRRTVLNIFPSVDTGVCAASVREFNERAVGLSDTDVVCVSQDLPFAQARFCGTEGLERVVAASGFRSTFGDDYGVRLVDGAFAGLLARAVVVLDRDGTVLHAQLVPEIGQEPDYEAAVAALG